MLREKTMSASAWMENRNKIMDQKTDIAAQGLAPVPVLHGVINRDIKSRTGKVLLKGTPVKVFQQRRRVLRHYVSYLSQIESEDTPYCDIEILESHALDKSVIERTWSGVRREFIDLQNSFPDSQTHHHATQTQTHHHATQTQTHHPVPAVGL